MFFKDRLRELIMYQTDEKRLEMAYRLRDVCQGEIAGGDTRPMFQDILKMSNKIIFEMEGK